MVMPDATHVEDAVCSNSPGEMRSRSGVSRSLRPLYWVLTAPHLEHRALEVLETWGSEVLKSSHPTDSNLYFFGAGRRGSLASLAFTAGAKVMAWGREDAPPDVPGSQRVRLRELALWRLVHDALPERQWYVKADDDTLLLVSSLESYLSQLDPEVPHFLGRRFRNPDLGLTAWAVSGGAGYVLSRAALVAMRNVLGSCVALVRQGTAPGWSSGGGDTALAMCLKKAGIEPSDTRDDHLRHRFHPFSFYSHRANDFGVERRWYELVSERPLREGAKCCGKGTAISFHYMSGQMQKFLHTWHEIRGQVGHRHHQNLQRAPSGDLVLKRFRQCQLTNVHGFEGQIYEITRHQELGVLFMHIFRTGGTSMNDFARARGAEHWTHMEHTQDELQKLWFDASLFRVALVRDPIDRVLSAFHEVKCRTSPEENCRSVSYTQSEHDLWLREFRSTLRRLEQHDYGMSSGYHFWPQVKFLCDKSGAKRPVDYLGSFENLEREAKFIFPFGGPLGHALAGAGFRLGRGALTREDELAICRIYFDDFCCFGYEFPKACRQQFECELAPK